MIGFTLGPMIGQFLLMKIPSAAKQAGGDMYEEARILFEASKRLAPEDWRKVYLAHFESAHHLPKPREPGVLQVGDRVMRTGADGARKGMGTVTAITARPLPGNRTAHLAEYVLDVPVPQEDGSERLGATLSPSGLVHASDWPEAVLGSLQAFAEVCTGILEEAAYAPGPAR